MAGGIGLLIPPLATWAAVGLAIIIAGAIYTHLTNAIPGLAMVVALFGVLIAIAYLRRAQALFLASGQ